jgi:hypothetical protein
VKVCVNDRGRGRESALPVKTSVEPSAERGVPGRGNQGIFCDKPVRVRFGPTRRLKRPATLSYSDTYPTSGPTFTTRRSLCRCRGAAMQTAELRSNARAPMVYDLLRSGGQLYSMLLLN